MELNKNLFRSITTFPGGPVDAVVEKAAKRHGITPTQVIFLWVKAKGAVIVTSVFIYSSCWVSIPDVDFISTSSSKQHIEQYYCTGDLGKLIYFSWLLYPLLIWFIMHNILAPLTDEEVAAIDAAGAKGPSVTLQSVKRLALREWSITDYLAHVTLLALLLMFGYYHWVDGLQWFAI